jgi:hypothetical protein
MSGKDNNAAPDLHQLVAVGRVPSGGSCGFRTRCRRGDRGGVALRAAWCGSEAQALQLRGKQLGAPALLRQRRLSRRHPALEHFGRHWQRGATFRGLDAAWQVVGVHLGRRISDEKLTSLFAPQGFGRREKGSASGDGISLSMFNLNTQRPPTF